MGYLTLNAAQLGGIEKIDGLYLKSFLFRVALAVVWVCLGVRNSVEHRGAISSVISRLGT
jgi:hypothetical protein